MLSPLRQTNTHIFKHIYTHIDSNAERGERDHPTAPEIWPFFSIPLSINPLPPSSIRSSFSLGLYLSFTLCLSVPYSQSLKFSLIQFYLPFTLSKRQAKSRPIKTSLMEDCWTGRQDSTAFRPNYFLPIVVTLVLQLYCMGVTGCWGQTSVLFLDFLHLNLPPLFISCSPSIFTLLKLLYTYCY